MMRNLPVPVNEEDIDQMFEFADKDKDGRINYSEFEIMINPQVKREDDGKKSLKSIKKFLPQLSSMAKKEGLSKKDEKPKGPLKVDTIISAFKDEKVPIKL